MLFLLLEKELNKVTGVHSRETRTPQNVMSAVGMASVKDRTLYYTFDDFSQGKKPELINEPLRKSFIFVYCF